MATADGSRNERQMEKSLPTRLSWSRSVYVCVCLRKWVCVRGMISPVEVKNVIEFEKARAPTVTVVQNESLRCAYTARESCLWFISGRMSRFMGSLAEKWTEKIAYLDVRKSKTKIHVTYVIY